MSTSSPPDVPSQATCILRVGIAAPAVPATTENRNIATAGEAVSARPSQIALCNADIARDDLTGLVLGPYALGRKIGGGGMGKVFAARHVSLDKPFAIKFIRNDVVGFSDARARFEQEVRALGKLQHSHIVNAVDAGSVDGLQYLVTEFVAGEDLAQLVRRVGALPIAEACELIRQAAVGLAHSHRCGFLHRDIKPSNLILDTAGCVKLLDFGLVRSAAIEQDLTMAGEMLGTWDFVAPEQMQDARHADGRSDLYGLGCTLLYLLSGRAPFSDAHYSTPAAKLKGHLLDEPTWLKSPPASAPKELVKLLARLTAKSPNKRPQTADGVATALEPLAQRADLSRLKHTATQSAARPPIATQTKAPSIRRRLLLTAGLLVACGVNRYAASGTTPNPPMCRVSRESRQEATNRPASTPPSESRPAAKPVQQPEPTIQRSSPTSPSRVTNDTKQTHNAAAVRIGLFADEPVRPNRKFGSAPLRTSEEVRSLATPDARNPR